MLLLQIFARAIICVCVTSAFPSNNKKPGQNTSTISFSPKVILKEQTGPMQAKTAPSIAILLDIVAPPVADDAVTLCDNWSSSSKPRLCQSGFVCVKTAPDNSMGTCQLPKIPSRIKSFPRVSCGPTTCATGFFCVDSDNPTLSGTCQVVSGLTRSVEVVKQEGWVADNHNATNPLKNIQLLDASGKSAMAARDITAAGTETAETPSIGGANLVGTESVGTESVVPTSAISSNATQQTSTAASLLTLQTTSTVSGVFGESAPPVLVPTTTVTSVFREVAPPTDAGVGQAETETVSKEVGTETAEIITNVVLGAAIGALYSATPSSESTTSQSTSSVFVDVAGQDLASVGPSLTISSVAKPVLDVWVLAVLDLSVAIIFV